jgi:hypothetical protein
LSGTDFEKAVEKGEEEEEEDQVERNPTPRLA